MDLYELNQIAQRVTTGEFQMFLYVYGQNDAEERCVITLEKGSAYGGFHLKVEARAATPSEAFEKALAQFPSNPLDGVSKWDTRRLAAPCEEGDFNETT